LNPRFNTDGVKKDALHVIVIGANDLMLASAGLDQIVTQWSNLDKTAIEVARSTATQIQALASAGVTRVMWGNVFNVAQAPSVVAKAKTLGGFIASPYLAALTKSVEAHNREMDEAIDALGKSNPSLKIIKLDLYARFAEVAADPAKFGFENVTTGANDNRHLFSSDGLHPTPQGHKMLAEYAFSVLEAADPARRAALAPGGSTLK
jgi:phospholipase/lecithinase/hemolysin